jgi:hypothetical protein
MPLGGIGGAPYPGFYSRVASGSSVENGAAINSRHAESGMG